MGEEPDRREHKRRAAEAALELVRDGMLLGVGTGSTTAFFIDGLSGLDSRPAAVVPSSEGTDRRLRACGVATVPMETVSRVDLYVDGADEVAPSHALVKGRGGALIREKVLATIAASFVCIVDDGKLADRLGVAPVPVEVVPAAAGAVVAALRELAATVDQRTGYVTDNGNLVVDVCGLDLSDPERTEIALEVLPGVVGCGIFARRPADLVLAAGSSGLRRRRRPAA